MAHANLVVSGGEDGLGPDIAACTRGSGAANGWAGSGCPSVREGEVGARAPAPAMASCSQEVVVPRRRLQPFPLEGIIFLGVVCFKKSVL